MKVKLFPLAINNFLLYLNLKILINCKNDIILKSSIIIKKKQCSTITERGLISYESIHVHIKKKLTFKNCMFGNLDSLEIHLKNIVTKYFAKEGLVMKRFYQCLF